MKYDLKRNRKHFRPDSEFMFTPTVFDLFGDPLFERHSYENEGMFKMNVIEKEDVKEYEIEMPGVTKSDITVELIDDVVRVEVKHQEEKKEEKDGKMLLTERKTLSGSREFFVGDVKIEDINVKLEDGLLKIAVKKTKPKKQIIKITDKEETFKNIE